MLKHIVIYTLLLIAANAMSQSPWRILDDIDWLTYPAARSTTDIQEKDAFVFAEQHDANWTFNNSGRTIELDDGSIIWTLGIRSESAENMNVRLENVYLNPNEQIYIYSPSSSEFQCYTVLCQSPKGIVQSLPVDGDSIIIEYHGYKGNRANFFVKSVNCGFASIRNDRIGRQRDFNKVGKVEDASECEVDVSCYSEDFSDVSQSVCRLFVNGNSYGSGVLINNTAHDGKPYIITSAHVISKNILSSCLVRFNFDMPMCEGFASPDNAVIQCDSLAYFDELRDVALLYMNDYPTDKDRPYYSGWDLSEMPKGPYYSLHHPMGDVKKISKVSSITSATYTMAHTNSDKSFDSKNHWKVAQWDLGVTEIGSSGGGLWSGDKLYIGSLTGGAASCKSPKNDYYWRLNNNWDKMNGEYQLRDFLDSKNTGITTLQGEWIVTEKYEQIFGINTSDVVVSDSLKAYNGFIAGHNTLSTQAIAQQFGDDGKITTITGLYVVPKYVTSSHGHYFNISISKDNGGMPGEEVYVSENIKNDKLKADRIYYHELPKECSIKDKFYVVVNLNYGSAATDTLAFYYSLENIEKNGARFLANGTWYEYSYFVDSELNCNLFFGYKGYSKDSGTLNTEIPYTNSEIKCSQQKQSAIVYGREIDRIDIYNIKGMKISTFDVKRQTSYNVNMNMWSTGIYIFKVFSGNDKYQFKVINAK